MILFAIIDEGSHPSCLAIEDFIYIERHKFCEWGLLDDAETVPSHDTIRRVLMSIKPASLQNCLLDSLYEFMNILKENTDGYEHKSVDGKEIKGSGRGKSTNNPLRNTNVLNLYDNSLGICISSTCVDGKTNEIPVAQETLQELNLKNTVITFDALHTQKETCKIIHNGRGIFVAPIKENQKSLLEEAKVRLEKAPDKNVKVTMDKRIFEIVTLPKNYASSDFGKIRIFIRMTSKKRKSELVMYFMSNSYDYNLAIEAVDRR